MGILPQADRPPGRGGQDRGAVLSLLSCAPGVVVCRRHLEGQEDRADARFSVPPLWEPLRGGPWSLIGRRGGEVPVTETTP